MVFVIIKQNKRKKLQNSGSALVERGGDDLHLDLAAAHVGVDMLTDLCVFDRDFLWTKFDKIGQTLSETVRFCRILR